VCACVLIWDVLFECFFTLVFEYFSFRKDPLKEESRVVQ